VARGRQQRTTWLNASRVPFKPTTVASFWYDLAERFVLTTPSPSFEHSRHVRTPSCLWRSEPIRNTLSTVSVAVKWGG
jgi:hypothetical protein